MKNFIIPLSEEQLAKLKATIKELTPLQLAWVSGYFWNLASSENTDTTIKSEEPEESNAPNITIISASQTGNARKIAEQLYNDVQRTGLKVNLQKAGEYKFKHISKEDFLFIITSTQGEGEPPEEALPLYKFLFSNKISDLTGVKYAVFGLGDTSYDFFSKAGKDFDARLSELGGQRVLDRVDADVDYQLIADDWRQKVVEYLSHEGVQNIKTQQKISEIVVGSSLYTKENPFTAVVSVNQKITARQSEKEVRHLEIDISNSHLYYQPGDTLGIWYKNSPDLIDEILSVLKLDKNESVHWEGKTISIFEALTEHYEITQNNKVIASKYAGFTKKSKLKKIVSNVEELSRYVKETPLVDMLREYPVQLSAEQFLSCLRPLTPRLYSISSSQAETEDEVHITVGVVRYHVGDKERTGGASGYLATLKEGDEVKIFIEPNDRFRLPADDSAPIIMIGAGTGIAPYRAFLQQREADVANGKNWLFFGNQHFISDFLYQVEWQRYVKSGILTRIDLAWSRDQEYKIYVQDRIREQSKEIWKWLQDGAYIYVCGDASQMAKEVENTLLEVIKEEGNLSQEQAEDFIDELRSNQRYQRDIY
ncbi:MAG: NADPH-dependent assimilatory sulfite reductase flavoprotein subunit [Flavobacteriaceae bacterium]|jgi:sulfite reductase (NADPH) flavoprotein alpha-component|nr:NADPH-dependent assimilatory sulfite reductase flavoprotein subunit [Flavobacteriaceae bacterium]